MKTSKYINSQEFSHGPYQTIKQTVQFYFPVTGKFEHAPSNISENLVVTAKSATKILHIGKKIIIKKVQTFKDQMMITKGLQAKQKAMLDLFENKEDLFSDEKFKFSFNSEVLYFLNNDSKFYLDAMKILRPKIAFHKTLYNIAFDNRHKLLKEAAYKQDREFVMSLIKCFFMEALNRSCKFIEYVHKPVDCELINYSTYRVFDVENKHLEYFPIVN